MTLATLITDAARRAFENLFESEPGDYYYCTLVTIAEGFCPVVAAWSWQALYAAAASSLDRETAAWGLKWSYADSPFFAYGYEELFEPVRAALAARPEMMEVTDEEWERELAFRLEAMEVAMAQLDSEGLFGSGTQRDGLVLLAEIMPPEPSNIERAYRLNPHRGTGFEAWLAEAAEFPPEASEVEPETKPGPQRRRPPLP